MREIKFRAWDRKLKRMFPVHQLEYCKITNNLMTVKGVDIHHKDSDHEGDVSYGGSVKKMTGNPLMPRFELMQFTERHDKYGFEVYEGDIVRGNDNYDGEREIFGIVDFQDCSFVIKNDCVTNYRWMDYTIEVVGNKWENPELLELKEIEEE